MQWWQCCKLLLSLVLLITLHALVLAEEENEKTTTEPVELSPSNYEDLVTSSSSPILVAFDGPPDDANTISLGILREMGEKLSSYGIKTGFVDCSSASANKKICMGASLRTVPTFQLFVGAPTINPYTKKMIRNPVVYSGRSHSARSIESFVSKSFSSYVIPITKTDEFDDQLSLNKEKPVAIFCTTHVKASIPMILKSIAFQHSSRGVTFLHVNNGEKDLLSHVSVSADDKLTVRLPNGDMKVFGGDLKKSQEVTDFFNQFTSAVESDDVKNKLKAEQLESSFKSSEDLEKFVKESVEHTVLLAVYNMDIEVEIDKDVLKILRTKISEGMIQYKELKCSSVERSEELKIVSEICSSSNKIPYLLTIPYGDQNRKKMTKSLNRFKFEVSEYEDAKQSLLESLPDDVFPLNVESMNIFLSQSVERRKLSIVVLSEKAYPPMMIRNIANYMKKIAAIGFFPNPPKEVLANFGNPPPPVPSVVAMFPQPNSNSMSDEGVGFAINVFNPKMFGRISFESLRDFIIQTYSVTGMNENDGQFNDEGMDETSENRDVTVEEVTSEDEWSEHCSTQFRGICAIAFINGNETDAAEELTDRFEKMARGIGKNAAAFKFLTVNAICQSSFADQFDVQDGKLPTVTAYSPSKQRYANVKAPLVDTNVVKDFLISVATGKIATQPISDRPKMLDACDIPEEIIETESSEDAADFLEEIRREEEEKAKRMKEELEEERKAALEEEKRKKEEAEKSKKKKKKKKKKSSKGKEL